VLYFVEELCLALSCLSLFVYKVSLLATGNDEVSHFESILDGISNGD
jgi:hypothetical protein